MKKIICTLLPLVVLTSYFAQNNQRTNDLYVAFHLHSTLAETILSSYNLTWEKAIPYNNETFSRMEKEALRVSGDATSVNNLRHIYKITSEELTDADLKLIAKELMLLEDIRYCDFMSRTPIKPPFDIPPTTPNYVSLQTYIGPNPGVNMQYAWDMGLNGQEIRVRDVEYGFNKNHEEFHQNPNVFLAEGYTVHEVITEDYSEHGTGTFGVVVGDNGGFGVKGLAYGIEEMILYPEYTEQYYYSRVTAVSNAIQNSNQGDVIIYEMQAGGATDEDGDFVPAEYEYPIWDLTKVASDMGIIIVAAAGNGGQNLDDEIYTSYMERPNSGAIIVGAGSPNTQHNRMWFSTYGSRVNLQGWGSNVLSSGYGDYSVIGGDFNQQYTMFSGTSSATPIVASCAIVLQSYYHSLTGDYLNSEQLIDIFQTTGIPQGWQSSHENIGPLPNMEEAILYIQTMMGVEGLTDNLNFVVYPNPFENEINIVGNNNSNSVKVEIHTALGQSIFKTDFLKQTNISIENLPKGIYFLRLTQNGKTTTKKIIRN